MNYVIRKILNDVTTLILCLKQLHLNMKKYEKDLFQDWKRSKNDTRKPGVNLTT